LLLVALTLSVPKPANALDNAWTKPGSGSWEDMYWTLGSRPGPGQAVQFTNAGWKALAITATTAASYPQTLEVDSVILFAPTNSYNVLLLNYAGYNTPLRAKTVTINSNCVLTSLSSSLQITNTASSDYRLEVGGTVNHGDFSAITASFLSLGNIGPGIYNLTNGTLQIGTGYIGGTFPGLFNHEGGYNTVSLLRILGLGEYDLRGGALGGPVELYGGILNQTGGLFTGPLNNNGTYVLAGGTSQCAGMSVPTGQPEDRGGVLQTGGTNMPGGLEVGIKYNTRYYGAGIYTLSNGVLVTSGTTIHYSGTFAQYGGTHTIHGPLTIHGDFVPPNPGYYADGAYYLNGGLLTCDSLDAEIAYFSQSGGTNQVAGELFCGYQPSSSYNLSGGTLMTSNTTVEFNWNQGFYQSGGIHIVTNELWIDGSTSAYLFQGYRFSGGEIVVKDIRVSKTGVFHHAGGKITHSGLLILEDGTWEAGPGTNILGRLVLGDSGLTNSSLVLPGVASVMRFAGSASVQWSNQSVLTIQNWAGSMTGGGTHQVTFGASPAGLSSQQLSQIRFNDPAGFPPGTYGAMMTTSGEVVPLMMLVRTVSGPKFIVQWDGAAVLQTATNLSGPFVDLPGASSPYTNAFTDPIRFFRTRR
jgi:hypothetical protein